MNEVFAPPLVEPVRGGARGGGAMLTAHGHRVLDSFGRLEDLSKAGGNENSLALARQQAMP
jgi:molybdate transport system regulatory protein